MENVITFVVMIVFLLIVYSYATGRIEKRKNGKAEKKAGRLMPAVKVSENPDDFSYSRVLVLPCSPDTDVTFRDLEIRMESRINKVLREIEELGGHDVNIDSFLYCDFVQNTFLIVIFSCRRPHVNDEG